MEEYRGTIFSQIFFEVEEKYFFSSSIILGVSNELETKAGRDVCDNVVVVFG